MCATPAWHSGAAGSRPRVIPGRSLGQPAIRLPGGYGGAVDGDRTQVLLVDLGGVLFSFDHGHRLTVLGQCLGLPPGRVDELLWQSGFSADCDAGRYRDAAAVRAQIRRITGYAGPDERLDAAWCSAFWPDPDVTGLLARHPGGRRGVFTNNGPLEEEVLIKAVPGRVRAVRAPVLLLASYREQARPRRVPAGRRSAGGAARPDRICRRQRRQRRGRTGLRVERSPLSLARRPGRPLRLTCRRRTPHRHDRYPHHRSMPLSQGIQSALYWDSPFSPIRWTSAIWTIWVPDVTGREWQDDLAWIRRGGGSMEPEISPLTVPVAGRARMEAFGLPFLCEGKAGRSAWPLVGRVTSQAPSLRLLTPPASVLLAVAAVAWVGAVCWRAVWIDARDHGTWPSARSSRSGR